jgi:hypothetical protein
MFHYQIEPLGVAPFLFLFYITRQESERQCALGVSMLPFSMILILDFGTVLTSVVVFAFDFIL